MSMDGICDNAMPASVSGIQQNALKGPWEAFYIRIRYPFGADVHAGLVFNSVLARAGYRLARLRSARGIVEATPIR